MDKIRTFIAVKLPQHVLGLLSELQNTLGAGKDTSVKWIKPHSIHLTLKFLGNVDIETIPDIIDAMRKATENTKPFSLKIGDLGAFPNTKSPRVIWIGFSSDLNSLTLLQKNLERSLAVIGYPTESRSFSPHLTLGRVRNGIRLNQRRALAERLGIIRPTIKAELIVNSISLTKSELTPQGAMYTQLSNITL